MISDLLPLTFKEEVIRWIKEDCPTTDVGGYVVGNIEYQANLYCKANTILAGMPYVDEICKYLDLKCIWNVNEGDYIDIGSNGNKIIIAKISGKCRNLLLAERTCLNILSRASGVASSARKAVEIKESNHWHGYVAGTRKTTPGFKNVEKYALVVGGAATHRLDLSQMVMLKDNHIVIAGNITNAVKQARSVAGFSIKIEVECQSILEALEAAKAGADIVMLDNFTHESIHNAAKEIKDQYPHVLIEASGGIEESTMSLYMSPYIDIISRGSLTQGYACIDFSMKIIPRET